MIAADYSLVCIRVRRQQNASWIRWIVFLDRQLFFITKTYVNGAGSSSTAVYFDHREPVRGQGCCCCCWLFSFRFFTLQTHPTMHHTGQRLMNRSSVWMNEWLACSVFWTWKLINNIWICTVYPFWHNALALFFIAALLRFKKVHFKDHHFTVCNNSQLWALIRKIVRFIFILVLILYLNLGVTCSVVYLLTYNLTGSKQKILI